MERAPLCECGCGEPVTRAKNTRTKQGIKKGQWLRYLPGHAIRHAQKIKVEQFQDVYIMSNEDFRQMIKELSIAAGVING